MHYQAIIEKAEEFVRAFMKDHENLNLLYHRLIHTENVVTAVLEITKHYNLGEKDFFICMTAAWFHDIGYYVDIKNHEQIGAKKAEEFLAINNVDDETTAAIKNCILATRVPQTPDNLLEQIVCDADLYHFGTDDFAMKNKLMRKEAEALHHISINKDDWRNSTIDLLENHQYWTDYCKDLLNKRKKQNLEKLKKKSVKQESSINPIDSMLHKISDEVIKPGEKEKDDMPEQPERGAETLFRIGSSIGQRLNEQADTKAHILISVNSIIISVFLSIVVRKMETYPYLTIPVITFLVVNLITIIFSILAIRPSVTSGLYKQDQIIGKEVNLLFFGNFYQMSFDDYAKSMLQVIGDKHHLYLTLTKNLYDQGVVLGRKYRMLNVAYNVFMFGIIISVAAYLYAAKFLT